MSSSTVERSIRVPAFIAIAAAMAAITVVVVALVTRHGGTPAPPAPSVASQRPAPASVTPAHGLASSRVGARGIYQDGWVKRDASLTLGGGPTSTLEIRLRVPEPTGVAVQVTVGGRPLGTIPLAPGTADARLLVAASSTNRRIELHFARAVRLAAPDTRTAAARLVAIAVRPVHTAPRAVTPPLQTPSVGVADDGWMNKTASFVVAGGPPAELVLHLTVPKEGERLRASVDGAVISSGAATSGTMTVSALVPATTNVRRVDLAWSSVAPLSPADPRVVSARLASARLQPLRGAAKIAIPADLGRLGAMAAGIYPDGWAKQVVRVVLAGGPTSALSVRLETPTAGQRMTMLVDGNQLLSTDLAAGADSIRTPVAPSPTPRLLELRFAHVAPIASNDRRQASALLRAIDVTALAPTAPASIDIPADLSSPSVVSSGIYADGWAQQVARVAIAGGPRTRLEVAADTLTQGQSMTVVDNGVRLGAASMRPGHDLVRVVVQASDGPRLIELHFAKAARIAGNDPRIAATLLRRISVARSGTSPTGSTLQARLTTAAEVPAVPGSASGTFTARVSGATLHWQLSTSGLSGPVIAAVIHKGSAGEVGPALIDLCRPCSATQSGTTAVSTAVAHELENGSAYLNVGTDAHPYGEIRGPIVTTG